MRIDAKVIEASRPGDRDVALLVDEVQRLKNIVFVYTDTASDDAREIDRLQRSVTDWQLEADVHRERAAAAVAEIARLRLTDAEREAVSEVVDCLTETGTALANPTATRNTLASLLDRLA